LAVTSCDLEPYRKMLDPRESPRQIRTHARETSQVQSDHATQEISTRSLIQIAVGKATQTWMKIELA
jgi:hypothetical protein